MTADAIALLNCAYANTYGAPDGAPYADTAGEMPMAELLTAAPQLPLSALAELMRAGRLGWGTPSMWGADRLPTLTVVVADCPGCGYPLCDTFGDDCPFADCPCPDDLALRRKWLADVSGPLLYAIELTTPLGVRYATHSKDDSTGPEDELTADIRSPDVLLTADYATALDEIAAGCYAFSARVVVVPAP